MRFGALVKQHMEAKEVSARELALRSGMNEAYISRVLSGKVKEPTFTKACQIINALGVNVSDFADEVSNTEDNGAFNLRRIRVSQGYTQAEIGKHLGISDAAYSMIESGDREINATKLLKLAELYGCGVDDLLGVNR